MKDFVFSVVEKLGLRLEQHLCHPGPWAGWYAAWVDLAAVLVVLVTFGRVYTAWEVRFRAWQGKKYMRRKLLSTYVL